MICGCSHSPWPGSLEAVALLRLWRWTPGTLEAGSMLGGCVGCGWRFLGRITGLLGTCVPLPRIGGSVKGRELVLCVGSAAEAGPVAALLWRALG